MKLFFHNIRWSDRTTNPSLLLLSSVFLLLSGTAALTYQVTWVRLLGYSMGSTSASISTVLASFFLGLAIGSYLAERLTRRLKHNLTRYLQLEILIGISGLISLPALLHLNSVIAQVPFLGTALLAKFFTSIVILAVPTICMGATFPVMAAILIRQQNEMGLRISQLYSLNTAGAVLGAALSGFVFIPQWGLDGAIYIAASLNFLIVIVGFFYNRKQTSAPPLDHTKAETHSKTISNLTQRPTLRIVALITLFSTGFIAIATEVGWTKYLVIFTGTTIYGFAAILTIFLIGLSAGAWAIRSYIEKMRSPELWMCGGLILTGVALLLTRSGLSFVPTVYDTVNQMSAPAYVVHGIKYLTVFVLIFVPTFLLGALFPVNLKIVCENLQGVRTRIGKAYALNTVASIFGAIMAGFWIIPKYGTNALLTATAFFTLVLPLLYLGFINKRQTRIAIIGFSAIVMLAGHHYMPQINYKNLIQSVGYRYDNDAADGKTPEFLFLKEGKTGIISLVTYDGKIAKVQNNGLNESLIDLNDSTNALVVETLLGLMPYFLHNNPKTAFVVGFGGGITTRALSYTDLDSINVVELEPAVIEAVQTIEYGNNSIFKDPRVTINVNDARNTLLLEKRYYDIIVSQPSHPWRAGAANVFTEEFFELVQSRLNKNGIYGQWVNLFNMDVTTLKAIFKAFFNVFPQGMSLANLSSGDFLLFGSMEPLIFDFNVISKRFNRTTIKQTFAHHNVFKAEHLLWYFALSRQEIVQASINSVPNTDTNILSEVRLSKLVKQPKGKQNPYAFLKRHYNLDLIPYLKKETASTIIYNAGLYFLHYDRPNVALKAVKQLEKIDAIHANSLKYEVLWTVYDFESAFKLYTEQDQWLKKVHSLQALALIATKKYDAAKIVILAIKDPYLQNITRANLFYAQKDWKKLAHLDAKSDEEKQWQLIGQMHTDLDNAGAQLNSLISENSKSIDDIPALIELIRYQISIQNSTGFNKRIQQLAKIQEKLVNRLLTFTNQALDKKQVSRSRFLINKIREIKPNTEKLEKLAQRLADIST